MDGYDIGYQYANESNGTNTGLGRDGNGNGTIDPEEQVSLAAMICLPIIIAIGVIGNTLVCIAVVKVRKLRTVANTFVVSLAISDLAVCLIVLPLGLYEAINYGMWHLGDITCNAWLSVDLILSTASVWNLCAIAGDRWLAITKPIWYANRRSTKLAVIALCVAWGVPVAITIPSAIMMHRREREWPLMCYPHIDFSYIIFACLVAFFLPCLLVLGVYVRIFIAARDHFVRMPSQARLRKKSTGYTGTERSMDSFGDNPNRINGQTEYTQTTSSSAKSTNAVVYAAPGRKISASTAGDNAVDLLENRQIKRRISRVSRISVSREKKAAIVLSIVVGAFIVCWLPYFIAVFVLAVSGGAIEPPRETFVALTWLGWMNSIINPIIYTIFTRDFRHAFQKILQCKCNISMIGESRRGSSSR